jgi:hypothetical protein
MCTLPMEEFKKKVLAGEREIKAYSGEPGTYEGGLSHIDPQPTFHPPSLKKPKRVPTDDPMEKDNSFLDVTKRGDKATKKFRLQQMKKHPTLGGIPPNTAVQHHTSWGGGSGPVI